MFSCLRTSFRLPKKLLIYNTNSSSKSFSALSPDLDKCSSNYVTSILLFKKTIKPKQIQYRFFSPSYTSSFFESIRSSDATKLVTNILIGMHDYSGIYWYTTIITATVLLKLIVSFPCGLYQQYLFSKLELTKIELAELVKRLRDASVKTAVSEQWTQEKFQSEFRKKVGAMWKTLVVKNNCHPFKITILFFVQLPFWLVFTIAIRSLALDYYYGDVSKIENQSAALKFLVGGPFWTPNLSLPDPTYILPTLNTLSMLTLNELCISSKMNSQLTKGFRNFFIEKIVPNFIRLLAVAFFFISSASPSAVSLFWTTSSLCSLGQNLLLMSPRVRRLLRIPKSPSEVDKPYSRAFNNFVQRFVKIFTRKK